MKEVWIITNSNGVFLRAYDSREKALDYMKMWRENMIHSGMFGEISRIDAVYYDVITFDVTMRDGTQKRQTARKHILY